MYAKFNGFFFTIRHILPFKMSKKYTVLVTENVHSLYFSICSHAPLWVLARAVYIYGTNAKTQDNLLKATRST